MILGNYLVTRGEEAAQHLVAAMVLSIPWNVFVGTESLEKPLWNLLLNRHLAHCLCESIKSMRKQLEGDYKWDLDHVMQVSAYFSNTFLTCFSCHLCNLICISGLMIVVAN